jgi:hypothetical protein
MVVDYTDGKTMHIDTSRRFKQRGHSSVAFKIVSSGKHSGIILSNRLKRELDKNFSMQENYPLLYAICIYYLIKDKLELFDNLVICNDEDFRSVKKYLDLFFGDNVSYGSKNIVCIGDLRALLGDAKVKSYADNIANIYRKKALKPLRRQQKGIVLNICEINYKKIELKINEIKGVGGW